MKKKDILDREIDLILDKHINCLSAISGKIILVTGATGLIGFSLIQFLLKLGKKTDNPPKILALVRNIEKAKEMFGDQETIRFIHSNVEDCLSMDFNIDFIVHGASQTASSAFVNEPVETIMTAIQGTNNMLNLAKEKKVKSFVYLSSMEVYGAPESDEKINENHATNLNTMAVRSSYPESKRMCESLCASFCSEYNVPAKVIRLTQTFGPGVNYNDGRVFADFARAAIENRDIVLHTKGETKRSYLYTIDAVTAILSVLLNGEDGHAYNAANESTYCSIFEMANLVAEKCASNKIKVIIQEENSSKFGYAPILKMNLETAKIRKLGWMPTKDLIGMFTEMIKSM
ncbi:MAG: NAD-dependent epimerase/dehydratase family protein [Bacteroidales bacterium]|nr:NAD-dependent epimerase/dehydratase family protein [Bacteroidales bacterium]